MSDSGKVYNHSRAVVTHALGTGQLVPAPCEVCGATKTDAHHEDYLKPLSVRWLCRKHHRLLHSTTKINAGAKVLTIPIDDSLMAKLKAAALKRGQTLRVYVIEAIKQAMGSK